MLDPWGTLAGLNKEEIRALQNRKLREFINEEVYPFSPYYRKLFDDHKIHPRDIRTVEDLKHIPFTSKNDFIATPAHPEKFKEFVLQPDQEKITRFWPIEKKLGLLTDSVILGRAEAQEKLSRQYRPCFITFTTGTTNKPVSFLYSHHDMQNLHLSGSRMLSLFEIKNDERVMNIFPYAPHLAFWQVVFGGLSSCVMIFSSGGGKVMGTEGNISAIVRMRPSVILGVPSYVYHVLRLAQEKGCRMEYVKKIVLGAARVTEGFKEKIIELLKSMGATGVSVFGTYGFTEARAAWAECPTKPGISSGYHLYPDQEIIEIIDPKTGEVKGEGQDGEIVYTALNSRCSVVVRYRTGDYLKGGVSYAPCSYCGRTVARLSSDITRISDIQGLQLSKIKGSLVNLNDFAAILNDFGSIVEWQIEIRKKNNDPHEVDELVVYIASKPDADRLKLESDVRNKIKIGTEVAPNGIVFLPLDELVKRLDLETANKEKRILDTRPK